MRLWIAIYTGSAVIVCALCDWIARRWFLHTLAIALAAGFAKGLPHTGAIVALLFAAWLVGAVMLGLPLVPAEADEPEEEPAEDQEEEQPDTAKKARPEVPWDVVVPLLHDRLLPAGGVHLKTLAEALPGDPWATHEVRALLDHHGIRVRAGVRVPMVGGREGVHRDDIPPLHSPAPEGAPVGVVAPGQSNNNNAETASGGATEKGYSILPDPESGHRWRVVNRQP